MQRIKRYLDAHAKTYELLRYVVAGGLTTLLSLIVTYGLYILLSEDHTINGANAAQMVVSNAVSWVVSVLFAFWINRRMVFRVYGGARKQQLVELVEFAGSRVVSFLVFEQGLALALKAMGVSNLINRLIVLLFVMVFNYVASKFWVFAKKAPRTPAQAPQEASTEAEAPPPEGARRS